jgi:hypothetical protein
MVRNREQLIIKCLKLNNGDDDSANHNVSATNRAVKDVNSNDNQGVGADANSDTARSRRSSSRGSTGGGDNDKNVCTNLDDAGDDNSNHNNITSSMDSGKRHCYLAVIAFKQAFDIIATPTSPSSVVPSFHVQSVQLSPIDAPVTQNIVTSSNADPKSGLNLDANGFGNNDNLYNHNAHFRPDLSQVHCTKAIRYR